jgi:hypothetical protein
MGLFSSASGQPFIWSGSQLTPDQIAALALGAPYLADRPDPFDVLPPAGLATGPDLASAWGLTDRDSALEVLRQLGGGLDDATYRAAAPLVRLLGAGADPEKLHLDLLDQAEGDTEHREFLFRTALAWADALRSKASTYLPRYLPDSIFAWDAARLVDLARAAHSRGWLSAAEVWELLLPARTKAAAQYPSWREFGIGFLVGRSFWAATRGEDDPIKATFDSFAPVVIRLQKQSSSPWLKVTLQLV